MMTTTPSPVLALETQTTEEVAGMEGGQEPGGLKEAGGIVQRSQKTATTLLKGSTTITSGQEAPTQPGQASKAEGEGVALAKSICRDSTDLWSLSSTSWRCSTQTSTWKQRRSIMMSIS